MPSWHDAQNPSTQDRLVQSLSPRQHCPSAQAGQTSPPQSMPLSSPLDALSPHPVTTSSAAPLAERPVGSVATTLMA